MSITVVIPTAGRPTLDRAVASVTHQLEPGDEIIIVRDDVPYGNVSRDHACASAGGTHLAFLDDDDVFAPDALEAMHAATVTDPDRVHIFRMDDHGTVLWSTPVLEAGNIGSPMLLVPNDPVVLGHWNNEHGQLSDFGFLAETMRLRGDQPVWHEDVVALVRP